MRNRILLALLPICLIVFSGCFEFGEDIWINPDGTGRLRIDIALPEALLSMGKNSAPDSSEDLGSKFRAAEKTFRANPQVTRVATRDTVIDEMHHFMIEVDAKSFADLPGVHKVFFSDSTLSSGSEGPGHPELAITSSNNLIHVAFTLPPDTTQHADSSGAADSMSAAITSAMFGDKGFVFRLHAQNISKSSGAIDTVAHTTEWKIPFTAMKKAGGKTFSADIVVLQPITSVSVWGWVIAAALVLIGFVAFVLRRNASKRTS